MKRLITRFSILVLLSAAALWISTTNDARTLSCISPSQMWDAMATCDGAFWTGASPHYDVINHNPNHCHTEAANACQNLWGQPGYSNCYSNAYNSCVTSAQNSYYTAIDNYGSCLTAAVNPDCFEVPEFCPGAIQRASECEALANEDCCAYSDCLSASGVWRCQ